MSQKIDRDKYIAILHQDGINAALTALHQELGRIEYDTFEGPGGYKPDQLEILREYRDFSKELWTLARENKINLG